MIVFETDYDMRLKCIVSWTENKLVQSVVRNFGLHFHGSVRGSDLVVLIFTSSVHCRDFSVRVIPGPFIQNGKVQTRPIRIESFKSGRTFVNTVKTSWKFIKNQNEIDVDSILIHLFYQKSNYFISTRGKRARRKKRVHQTPKISKNFTQEKFERHTWNIWAKNQNLDETQKHSYSKIWNSRAWNFIMC